MANYATLKAAIQQVVKTNGNNEITGALLQQSLLAMINSLGVGYQFAGIATPSTNPGTPDQRVFYLASTPGTYTNFDGSVLSAGVAILYYDTAWHGTQLFGVNASLTTNGQDAVTSKGIALGIAEELKDFGYKKINLTGSRTFAFPIKSGEKITIVKKTAGGASSQIYFRKDYGVSTGQVLIGSGGVGTLTFTAADNFNYIYFYLPNLSGTFEAEIIRNGSVYSLFGYQFAGIATTSTNPGTPSGKVFYLAMAAGTYTNFGGVELNAGLSLLMYNGTSWTGTQIYNIATAMNYTVLNRADNTFANNAMVQKRIAETDKSFGYIPFSATGSSYIVYPIKNGEQYTIIVKTPGGQGAQLYARKTTSSTGQKLVGNLTVATSYDFTATDDYELLYVYLPNISGGTCSFEFIKKDGLYQRVANLEAESNESPSIFYQLSSTYDNDHNAKRFFVFVKLSGNIFVRFRLGQYRPGISADDRAISKTYWRLEDSALYQYSNGAFTLVSGSSITTSGENEFVLRQTSPNKVDYTGGYHGDEYIYDENGLLIDGAFAEFFADGALLDLSQDIALKSCKTFFYKERSPMFETANSNGDTTNVGRQIAWHEKRTEFLPEKGYETENRLDMVVTIPFFAFGGICCISRWLSEYAMGEGNQLTAMGTGSPERNDFSNYGNRLIYYKGHGYSARVTSHIIFGDDDAAQHLYVYNTTPYNKYYRISQTLTDATKFKSKMVVTFEKL